MAEFSDYLENNIIDHMLRNQAFTPPTTVYLALFTADTGLEANNPSAEVSGGSYAREACALDAASGGVTANTSDVTFTEATASWGTVSHVALVDHLSNTNWGTDVNVLVWTAVDTGKAVDSGDTAKFSAGNFDITIT